MAVAVVVRAGRPSRHGHQRVHVPSVQYSLGVQVTRLPRSLYLPHRAVRHGRPPLVVHRAEIPAQHHPLRLVAVPVLVPHDVRRRKVLRHPSNDKVRRVLRRVVRVGERVVHAYPACPSRRPVIGAGPSSAGAAAVTAAVLGVEQVAHVLVHLVVHHPVAAAPVAGKRAEVVPAAVRRLDAADGAQATAAYTRLEHARQALLMLHPVRLHRLHHVTLGQQHIVERSGVQYGEHKRHRPFRYVREAVHAVQHAAVRSRRHALHDVAAGINHHRAVLVVRHRRPAHLPVTLHGHGVA